MLDIFFMLQAFISINVAVQVVVKLKWCEISQESNFNFLSNIEFSKNLSTERTSSFTDHKKEKNTQKLKPARVKFNFNERKST